MERASRKPILASDTELGDVLVSGNDDGKGKHSLLDDDGNEGGGGEEGLVDDEEDDEFEDEDKIPKFDIERHSQLVVDILKPVSFTMALVVWIVRLIHVITVNVSIGMVYHEDGADSTGTRLGGSLLNALVFVGIVTATTLLFVLLYKYRCMKILYGWLIGSTTIMLGMFGALLLFLVMSATNTAIDYVTAVVVVWNFAVVGVLAVFWRSPPIVHRAYLVAVSALMAIFFTFLPEWTTWAILAAISCYDLAAVLLPWGPLRMLVEQAQQRQEHIPALLYNGSLTMLMADRNNNNNYDDDEVERIPNPQDAHDDDDDDDKGGVKLGLGDFVFYSVLLGRAALFDMLTVFTCFIAILTGLFGTLILLAIFQKALPALPFSIALAMLFFFLTRFFLFPYILYMGLGGIIL